MQRQKISVLLASAAAGFINGLLGTGGGLILVPLLTRYAHLEDDKIFPTSVFVMVPVCVVSLLVRFWGEPFPWELAWPYLLAGIPGGLLAGIVGKHIPVIWLHRILGILIIYGGIRYLW